MQIKDLLTINLDDEINTVVDLDKNPTEAALKEGLDNFVLTNSLGKHLGDFLEEYNNGSMESGVWLSGFYGSGKSYFAQIIGMLLQNTEIFGTPIRERFSVKIDGLPNEDLLSSEIGNLARVNSIVITFDASKHNNINGLPYMIFSSFLRKLGMPDSWHGIIEYDILLEGRLQEFLDTVRRVSGKDWSEIIKSNTELSKTFKPVLASMGYSDEEYRELKALAESTRKEYDASRLQQDLSRYLDQKPDTRIVFFIDEVSEAIGQKKIRLDDLEGVAEALAALGRKVWTIAIAQQRLDDVIKAENIQLNSLTKVRDRFRTKIAIEADEVDTIIRHRLLAKTSDNQAILRDYFNEHNGTIADVTNIGKGSLDKTDNVDTYVDYYPFFKHQFKLLQYFLFGSSNLTQTRAGNRGMIISAFDVLKNEVKHQTTDHYHVNATQLCNQADNSVEESLSIRYRQAESTLANEDYTFVEGKKLLQTINFLTRGEVRTTSENIAKSYLNRPENFHEIHAEIKKALQILQRERIVIETGQQYRITNETEQRMLDEMRRLDIQSWENVQDVNNAIKKRDFVRWMSLLTISGMNIRYKVASADGEVYANPEENTLTVVLSDLLNTPGMEDKTFVDKVRQETADAKGMLTIIPTVKYRNEIKELSSELRRLKFIDEKTNLTDEEKSIVRTLCSEREVKEARFNELVTKSFLEGVAIYCFNIYNLNADSFRSVVNGLQEKMFENIYTKRLTAELSDSLAQGVFTRQPGQLSTYFGTSTDFKFFDTSGQFIGTSLSVVTEILSLCSAYTSGKDIESKLAGPPTGYSLGTVMTTLAALFRGDKIIVKYNGEEYTSWRKEGATDAFKNSRNFTKASFKTVSKSLSHRDRKEIVDILKEDCQFKKHLPHDEISYKLNDFEIVEALQKLSKEMIGLVNHKIADDYEEMFRMSIQARSVFQQYQSPVTEANFVQTAKSFLSGNNADDYIAAVERVDKDIKFINEKMREIRDMQSYLDEVRDQFDLALHTTEPVKSKIEHFQQLYDNDIVVHYAGLKKDVQDVRDIYISSFKEYAAKAKTAYRGLLDKAEALKTKLSQYPREWNKTVWRELEHILNRCEPLANITTTFDTFSVKSLGSRLDLRGVVTALENVATLDNSLNALDFQIRDTNPNANSSTGSSSSTSTSSSGNSDRDSGNTTPPPTPKTHKLKNQLPQGDISVSQYRNWLTQQLSLLRNFKDIDLINLNE